MLHMCLGLSSTREVTLRISFYTPHTALRRVTASDVWPVGAARLVSLFGKPSQALHEYSARLLRLSNSPLSVIVSPVPAVVCIQSVPRQSRGLQAFC